MALTEATQQVGGVFGSERVAVPGVGDAVSGAQVAPAVAPKVPVNDETLKGVPNVATGSTTREARSLLPDSSALEGAGAAVDQWITKRIIDRIARPAFDDETPINAHEYLQHTPLALSADEREYFVDVAKGDKSAAYAMQQIQDRRLARQVMGDHEVSSFAASMFDPIMYAAAPLRVSKFGAVGNRAATGALQATITGVGAKLSEGPHDDSEIALSMLMSGTMAATFFANGKLVKRADGFPSAELAAHVDEIAAASEAAAKPRYKLVQPEKWEEVTTPATDPVYEAQPIPNPIVDGAKPRYKNFDVEFDNPLDKAAYIIAGKGKSAKHAEILDWAKQTSGLTEEELIAHGNTIRDDLKAKEQAGVEGAMAADKRMDFKPQTKLKMVKPGTPASVERRKVQDAKYEEIPKELAPGGSINSSASEMADAVEKGLNQDAKSRGVWENLQWNMRKTMSKFGKAGDEVANLLYDNNSDLSVNSVESHREAILSGLRQHTGQYEDQLRAEMSAQGFGTAKMVNPFTSRDAYRMQMRIERDVQRELFRRETASRQGLPIEAPGIPPAITQMADTLDRMHKSALAEMKAAGVNGAENILERPGYLNRKWSSAAIDDVLTKLKGVGLTEEQSLAKVHGLVSLALRRANGWDKRMGDQVGSAIVDRAIRKGYFEDALFNAPAGEGQLKQLRDILKEAKVPHDDIERALSVLQVATDEAGKSSILKHRMDLDYKAALQVGKEQVSVMDLIDSKVTSIIDQYTAQVATSSAFARKGLKSRTDIEALRTKLSHDTAPEQRAAALDLFDNTMKHFRGEAAGGKMNEKFRALSNYSRTIALANSGLWQVTEYANAAAQFGLVNALKFAVQEMPIIKSLNHGKEDARSLSNILAEQSAQSLRLRPYLSRYEDGFEMDVGSAMNLASQTAQQLVPYSNAMKYIHHHQASMVGNLIVDRLEKAANGNAAAREALRKYGIESHVADKLNTEFQKHGQNVDAWDDAVWAAVRPAFAKMMDASVLKGRLGDMPAFAAFDPVGKFVFTYRSFMLVSHNKVMAGTGAREGAYGLGALLMYQAPLAMLAVQAQSVLGGKTLTTTDMAKKSLGQMGGLGFFSDAMKVVTGDMNSFGAPGLIPLDRGIKLGGNILRGDANQAASTLLGVLPVISANPFVKGLATAIKGN